MGGVLVLFAALTALGLVVARVRGRKPTPSLAAVVAAVVYVVISSWLFYKAVTNPLGAGTPGQRILGVVGVLALGLTGWALSRGRARRPRRARRGLNGRRPSEPPGQPVGQPRSGAARSSAPPPGRPLVRVPVARRARP